MTDFRLMRRVEPSDARYPSSPLLRHNVQSRSWPWNYENVVFGLEGGLHFMGDGSVLSALEAAGVSEIAFGAGIIVRTESPGAAVRLAKALMQAENGSRVSPLDLTTDIDPSAACASISPPPRPLPDDGRRFIPRYSCVLAIGDMAAKVESPHFADARQRAAAYAIRMHESG